MSKVLFLALVLMMMGGCEKTPAPTQADASQDAGGVDAGGVDAGGVDAGDGGDAGGVDAGDSE